MTIKTPVHTICHSQGGNTIRMLSAMLKGNLHTLHPTYFPESELSRQDMIKSIVTIGTPHKGTTVTDTILVRFP